jgi:hypothetical protein
MSSKDLGGKNLIALQQEFSEVLQQIQRSHQGVVAQIDAAHFGQSATAAKLSALTRVLHSSIGVLLCRDQNEEVVEYALSRSLSPMLVVEYQLQLPDKELIRVKLRELYIELEGGDD